MIGLCDVILGT